MKLKQIFELIKFLNSFQEIERNVRVRGRKSMENDAEHSYQLAMICWLFAENKKLKLNKEKVLRYALVHDLVEVYAGDTDPHKSSKSYLRSKEEREMRAVKQIKKKFPGLKPLHLAIEGYEKRNDRESQLVYMVDKILPVINTYNVSDKYYYLNGVTFKKYAGWLNEKQGKLNLKHIQMQQFTKELLAFLERNRKGFFADDI